MKISAFLLFTFTFLLALACRPSAAPVTIGNKPISINDVPQTNVPMPPAKPLGEMSWTIFDGRANLDKNEQKLKDLRGKSLYLIFGRRIARRVWRKFRICASCIKNTVGKIWKSSVCTSAAKMTARKFRLLSKD